MERNPSQYIFIHRKEQWRCVAVQIDVLTKPNMVGVGEDGRIGSRPGKCWKQEPHRSPESGPDSKEFKAAFSVAESTKRVAIVAVI